MLYQLSYGVNSILLINSIFFEPATLPGLWIFKENRASRDALSAELRSQFNIWDGKDNFNSVLQSN